VVGLAGQKPLDDYFRRSGPIGRYARERPVKPSAQPTLVRTQHLPPPAETARDLGILATRGPPSVVSSSVIVGQETAQYHDVYGHIADGFGPRGAVHRTACPRFGTAQPVRLPDRHSSGATPGVSPAGAYPLACPPEPPMIGTGRVWAAGSTRSGQTYLNRRRNAGVADIRVFIVAARMRDDRAQDSLEIFCRSAPSSRLVGETSLHRTRRSRDEQPGFPRARCHRRPRLHQGIHSPA
jgi:hypothetical protein